MRLSVENFKQLDTFYSVSNMFWLVSFPNEKKSTLWLENWLLDTAWGTKLLLVVGVALLT